jgi:hypothetical protein
MGYRQWVEVGPIEVFAVKQCRLTPEDDSELGWCVAGEC